MPTSVIMPKFEMAQESGTILSWLKNEGDKVEKGDAILEVQTDKVDMEVEAPSSGILAGIRAQAGQEVPVGQPIAYILKEGESLPAEKEARQTDAASDSKDAAAVSPSSKVTPIAARLAEEHGVSLGEVRGAGSGGRITRADVEAYLASRPPAPESAEPASGDMSDKAKAVPAARRLARELGVDLTQVSGSGPDGRVQSDDVRRAASAAPAPAAAAGRAAVRRSIPLKGIRRTIAERMTASVREAPQFTLSADVDMGRALEMLEDLRAHGVAEDASRVTMTAFLVRICACALQRHPEINTALVANEIIEWADINIGVAVAVEEGLVAPVVHHADGLGLREIAARVNDLAERARAGRLQLEDLHGGTFTISNLGMYAVDRFTAILNPPQAAILAVGRTTKRPVIVEEDQVQARPVATFTVTADHRVLDGAAAAQFLTTLQELLEHPGRLLE